MHQDDRTDQQLKTHTFIVGGHDLWMSGWGQCANGKSHAYWAARPEHARKVERWVRRTKDLKNVWATTTATLRLRHRKSETDKNHIHIYVVEGKHPALQLAGEHENR